MEDDFGHAVPGEKRGGESRLQRARSRGGLSHHGSSGGGEGERGGGGDPSNSRKMTQGMSRHRPKGRKKAHKPPDWREKRLAPIDAACALYQRKKKKRKKRKKGRRGQLSRKSCARSAKKGERRDQAPYLSAVVRMCRSQPRCKPIGGRKNGGKIRPPCPGNASLPSGGQEKSRKKGKLFFASLVGRDKMGERIVDGTPKGEKRSGLSKTRGLKKGEGAEGGEDCEAPVGKKGALALTFQ